MDAASDGAIISLAPERRRNCIRTRGNLVVELSRQLKAILALMVAGLCLAVWGLVINNVVETSGSGSYRGSLLVTVDPVPISVQVGEPVITAVHAYPDNNSQTVESWEIDNVDWKAFVPPDGDARVNIRRCGIGSAPDAIITATFNTPGKYDVTVSCQMTCINGDKLSGTRDLIVLVSSGTRVGEATGSAPAGAGV